MIEESQAKRPVYQEAWLAPLLIAAGLLLAIVFGIRATHAFMNMRQAGFHPQAANVEDIRGWMTVPGLAQAYHVPERAIFQQIGVPQQGNQHSCLNALNNRYFPGQPGEVISRVRQGISQLRSQNFPRPGGGR
jgi:hypothetical protein